MRDLTKRIIDELAESGSLAVRQAEAERDGAVRAGDELRKQRDILQLAFPVAFVVGLVTGFFLGLAVGGVFA